MPRLWILSDLHIESCRAVLGGPGGPDVGPAGAFAVAGDGEQPVAGAVLGGGGASGVCSVGHVSSPVCFAGDHSRRVMGNETTG
jgi:hypothetical protein